MSSRKKWTSEERFVLVGAIKTFASDNNISVVSAKEVIAHCREKNILPHRTNSSLAQEFYRLNNIIIGILPHGDRKMDLGDGVVLRRQALAAHGISYSPTITKQEKKHDRFKNCARGHTSHRRDGKFINSKMNVVLANGSTWEHDRHVCKQIDFDKLYTKLTIHCISSKINLPSKSAVRRYLNYKIPEQCPKAFREFARRTARSVTR